jgi:hypothetical protein
MKIKDQTPPPPTELPRNAKLFNIVCNHIYEEYDGDIPSIAIMLSISSQEAKQVFSRAIQHKLNNMIYED